MQALVNAVVQIGGTAEAQAALRQHLPQQVSLGQLLCNSVLAPCTGRSAAFVSGTVPALYCSALAHLSIFAIAGPSFLLAFAPVACTQQGLSALQIRALNQRALQSVLPALHVWDRQGAGRQSVPASVSAAALRVLERVFDHCLQAGGPVCSDHGCEGLTHALYQVCCSNVQLPLSQAPLSSSLAGVMQAQPCSGSSCW